MASLWELMAERENTQMAAMKERQAQFADNQRQRDMQAGLRQAVATRPQQTTFAEPQPVQQQPTTLAGLVPSLQADPSLTPITGRSGRTPEQATYGYLRENSPLDAADYSGKIMQQAHAMAQTGDHRGAVDFVNQSLGTKLEYQGSNGELLQVKNEDGTVLLYNTSTGEEKIIGTPKQRAPISVASGATLLDPVTMQPVYSSPQQPEYKQRERIDGNRTVFESSTDGGRTWTRVSEGPRYKPATGGRGGHGGADGDVGSAEAWARAIKDGRANLSDIPARGTIRTDVIRIMERDGGVDYAANTADNKAFAASIAQQQKQLGSMGSFVKNLDLQVSKVNKLSKDLSTFDTRLLNIPLRAVRGRIAGSPQQAKYDMYLAEIESEIGKLATGSTGSVAELSATAQERWAKIHDKNLSVKDMLQLLEETREAGKLRMKSVEDQLKETRAQMRNRGGGGSPNEDAGAFVKQQYAEYRKAGLKEDQIRQRVSSKLRKAGWKDKQIAAALRENSGVNGAIVTKGGFKVTKVD